MSLITKNMSASQRKRCAAWKVQSFPRDDTDTSKVCRQGYESSRERGKSVEAPITVLTCILERSMNRGSDRTGV
jgi:hypothetical protein